MKEETLHTVKTNYATIDMGVNRAIVTGRIFNALQQEKEDIDPIAVRKVVDSTLNIHDAMQQFRKLVD